MTLNKPQGLPVTGMGTGKEGEVGGEEMDGWRSDDESSPSSQGDPGS